MNCDELEDRLPGRDDAELRDHLAACPSCHDRAEGVLRLSALVASRTRPLSPEVRARVVAAAAAAARPRWGRRFLVTALAAAAVGVGVSLRSHEPPPPVPAAPAPPVVFRDRVERALDNHNLAPVVSADVVALDGSGAFENAAIVSFDLDLANASPRSVKLALVRLRAGKFINDGEYTSCLSELETAPVGSIDATNCNMLNSVAERLRKAEAQRRAIPTGK